MRIYRYVCVALLMCMDVDVLYVYAYMHVILLYVLYDYVQRSEDTVGVELRCIF